MSSKESPAGARPQFKKFKKKPKARLRSRVDDDDDEQDTAEESTMQAIQETKKKRKLLNQALYKKGLDATLTSTSDTIAVESTEAAPTTVKESTGDLTQRLEGTFAGEGGDATAKGGVLQRKHESAMETYIQQHLKTQESSTNNNDDKPGAVETTRNAKDKLYAELATTSQQLTGVATNTTTAPGDVGAGGAMLGGTGIAEVTLPADDRIQAIRATEEAVSSIAAASSALPESNRSSAVMQDGNDESITHAPSSYSHNFELHTQERWIQQKKQEDEQEQVTVEAPTNIQESHDGERMGFEAARRAARGDTGSGSNASKAQEKNRSGDDRAWKNFMTKQQQSRDRY